MAIIAIQDARIPPVLKKFDRPPRIGRGLLFLSIFEIDARLAHHESRKKGRALPDPSNGGLIELHGLPGEMDGGWKVALPKRNTGSGRRQLGKDVMLWRISFTQPLLHLIHLPGGLGERMRIRQHLRAE